MAQPCNSEYSLIDSGQYDQYTGQRSPEEVVSVDQQGGQDGAAPTGMRSTSTLVAIRSNPLRKIFSILQTSLTLSYKHPQIIKVTVAVWSWMLS